MKTTPELELGPCNNDKANSETLKNDYDSMWQTLAKHGKFQINSSTILFSLETDIKPFTPISCPCLETAQ